MFPSFQNQNALLGINLQFPKWKWEKLLCSPHSDEQQGEDAGQE